MVVMHDSNSPVKFTPSDTEGQTNVVEHHMIELFEYPHRINMQSENLVLQPFLNFHKRTSSQQELFNRSYKPFYICCLAAK